MGKLTINHHVFDVANGFLVITRPGNPKNDPMNRRYEESWCPGRWVVIKSGPTIPAVRRARLQHLSRETQGALMGTIYYLFIDVFIYLVVYL